MLMNDGVFGGEPAPRTPHRVHFRPRRDLVDRYAHPRWPAVVLLRVAERSPSVRPAHETATTMRYQVHFCRRPLMRSGHAQLLLGDVYATLVVSERGHLETAWSARLDHFLCRTIHRRGAVMEEAPIASRHEREIVHFRQRQLGHEFNVLR